MRPVVLVLLVAAACRSAPTYRAPVGDTPEATYAAIQAQGQQGIAPEDEALYRCEFASAALMVGDEDGAFRALDAASRIMGTLESSSRENTRAILGAEATKTWKGDPHERCMNALYKGLLYWRRGELDNASACFKTGLLADGWSEAGEHQEDFAALSFLLGWVSHLRGKTEQARFSFKEAAQYAPGHPHFADPRPTEHNVLVVADLGYAPEKFADGPGGSIARIAPVVSDVESLALSVDGIPAARTAPATDLYVQATTRGEKVIDGIRRGKAVFKTGAHVAGAVAINEGIRRDKGGLVAIGVGLLALSALTNAEADIRFWSQLPRDCESSSRQAL